MAAFCKKVGDNEPSSCSWNVEGLKGNPTWATLAAIVDEIINTYNPIRSASTASCNR